MNKISNTISKLGIKALKNKKSEMETEEFNEKLDTSINKLEEHVKNPKYFSNASRSGAISAAFTFLGYTTENFYSQIE